MIKYYKNGFKLMDMRIMKAIIAKLKRYCSWIVVLLLSTASVSANELMSVEYSALSSEKTKIKLIFSEQIMKPNVFSTKEPARIIIDLEGVKNRLAERTEQINLGTTKSLTAIEVGERTRIVVNLLSTSQYNIDQQGNELTLLVGGAKIASEMSNNDVATISNVDFRRGENGEAKIIISLDSESTAMDVHQERGNLVVDIVNAKLPQELNRRLDVVDFGTPVKFIETSTTEQTTSFTMITQGEYEHLAYQSADKLVVEIKEKQSLEASKEDQFGYSGEKLSLNFQNIEVRAVLQLLADFNNMNLVTSDTVTGNLTLRLKNVPWDQALDIILKSKGLAMRQSGNVMMIAPATEIAAREKQELDAKNQSIQLEPLYTEIFEISFAKATELAPLLVGKETVDGFLSSRGSISIDERTNSLLIRDTAENLASMQSVIEDLDKPVRQVLIESRIVVANNDFNKELGVRFGVTSQNDNSSLGTFTTSGQLETAVDAYNGDTVDVYDALNVDLPVTSAAGTIAFQLAKLPFGTLLDLELSAMQAEGEGEVISSPRVITANQKQATIKQGTEIPYQEASSSGSTSVSFKEAVLKLDVTPQITPDDRIVMDLEVSKDEVGEVYLGVPSIDSREVVTQVLVDNGETVVLGGIYEQSKTSTVEKVPFFGDLPYVGFMFRNNANEDRKRELLIFVTPKIVKEGLQY